MTPTNKTALRAAVLLHEQLVGSKGRLQPVSLPDYSWNHVQRLRQQIALACQRGWYFAAKRLGEEMVHAMQNCRRDLDSALYTLQDFLPERPLSSASNICRDILALEDEFEQVDIELGKHELSVTTDRIILEDLDLGDFQIRLDWHRLDSSSAYRVVALDPHPAAKNEGVTHPHVQDERLCEGEGRAAIRAALAECRVYDFFLLVSQILHTYARGSAFVELDDWSGATCSDCGATIDHDDSYRCQRCGSKLCDDCRQLCAGREESHCSGCLSQCPACEKEFCRGRMGECTDCRRRICAECLEDGLCPRCWKQQSQDEEEDDDAPSAGRDERESSGGTGASKRRQGAQQVDGLTHVRDGYDFLGFHISLDVGKSGELVPKIKVGRKALTNIRLRLGEAIRYRPLQESLLVRLARVSTVIRGWSNYFKHAHDFLKVGHRLDHLAFWLAVKPICRKEDISTAKCIRKYMRQNTIQVNDGCTLARFCDTSPVLDYRAPEPYQPGVAQPNDADAELEADYRFYEGQRPGRMDLKWKALIRDGFHCRGCAVVVTAKTSHADHIDPVNNFASLEMANDLDNIQTLCLRCHRLKTERER